MINKNKIAVVGIACRFPGADNLKEYWENLINGKECITFFDDEVLEKFELNYSELKNNSNYIPARGVLKDVDKFDASFFGYSPNAAALMDPQHRVWLETAWNAFEDAGCNPKSYNGSIGVYAGGYVNTYLLNNVLRDKQKLENFIRLRSAESFQILTANDISYLPTKTAYMFNLKGPAINVQTACSTSLVAIAQACNSLVNNETDACIAGGVCIITPQESGYIYQDGAIPSPDGHCRPFDKDGKGTVFSNGVGAVVLKRLENALEEKDHIYAVIDGWALNNDGNNKISYTAPGIEGQMDVILKAQKMADVSSRDISYIESHGTATQIGDPAEITALTMAFQQSSTDTQFCGIGSVKSNIGHTDAAAGIASFIKLCLIAKNKQIPPTIHYKEPNPLIDFNNSPFYVVDKLRTWDADKKLIMGVSSFGIGGTNAHIIIEEAPELTITDTADANKTYLLPVSAKSRFSVNKRKTEIVEFLKGNPGVNLDSVARTLWQGREHMKYRSMFMVNDNFEWLNDDNFLADGMLDESATALAFLFPGQGAQFVNMGKELYEENEIFRSQLDECFRKYENQTGNDLKKFIFNVSDEINNRNLSNTKITQPALFIIEYSLIHVLNSLQIYPSYLIGHSIGEYTAACYAGIFDFETALKIVIKRGELMSKMPTGNMLAVKCSYDELLPLQDNLFEITANNGPQSCTISFEENKMEEIEKLFTAKEFDFIPLNTSHAFHSKAFDPILSEFEKYVEQFDRNYPQIPVISCLTGDFLTPNQAVSGKYWADQLRNTVQFYPGIKNILKHENVIFMEAGPNSHLSSNIRPMPEFVNKKNFMLTLGRPENNNRNIEEKIIATLWCLFENFRPNLEFINLEKASKITLPGYPFEKTRHWIDYFPSDHLIPANNEARDQAEEIPQTKERPVSTSIEKIKQIWSNILGSQCIDDSDNFFSIGGNSLMAISVVDRAKKAFKTNIHLRSFFDAPTVKEFAGYIDLLLDNESTNKLNPKQIDSNIISGEI